MLMDQDLREGALSGRSCHCEQRRNGEYDHGDSEDEESHRMNMLLDSVHYFRYEHSNRRPPGARVQDGDRGCFTIWQGLPRSSTTGALGGAVLVYVHPRLLDPSRASSGTSPRPSWCYKGFES